MFDSMKNVSSMSLRPNRSIPLLQTIRETESLYLETTQTATIIPLQNSNAEVFNSLTKKSYLEQQDSIPSNIPLNDV